MPGTIIKEKRLRLGLSQAEVADRLFMSQSTYSRIENHQTALRVDQAKAIAAVLGCNLSDLLPDHVLISNSPRSHNPDFTVVDAADWESNNGNDAAQIQLLKAIIASLNSKQLQEVQTWISNLS